MLRSHRVTLLSIGSPQNTPKLEPMAPFWHEPRAELPLLMWPHTHNPTRNGTHTHSRRIEKLNSYICRINCSA